MKMYTDALSINQKLNCIGTFIILFHIFYKYSHNLEHKKKIFIII